MTEYIIKNGKAYPIVKGKASKKTPTQDNLKKTLEWFKSKNYKLIGNVTDAKYTNKAGKVQEIKRATFKVNGRAKQYNIGKFRTWAVA